MHAAPHRDLRSAADGPWNSRRIDGRRPGQVIQAIDDLITTAYG
jgi:hypothetical protein